MIRYWRWHLRRFFLETVPFTIAQHLPKRVTYWAFIRVYACLNAPGPDFPAACQAWEQRVGDCGWRKGV